MYLKSLLTCLSSLGPLWTLHLLYICQSTCNNFKCVMTCFGQACYELSIMPGMWELLPFYIGIFCVHYICQCSYPSKLTKAKCLWRSSSTSASTACWSVLSYVCCQACTFWDSLNLHHFIFCYVLAHFKVWLSIVSPHPAHLPKNIEVGKMNSVWKSIYLWNKYQTVLMITFHNHGRFL